MFRFIAADLKRHWLGALALVLLVAFATALSVAVTLQERALRLGSARAADHFDLVIGAAASETQLVLSSVFLQTSLLPLMDGNVLEKLSQDPRVAWAAPVGFGDNYKNYPIIGTTTKLVETLSPKLASGKMFANHNEAVVGANVDVRAETQMVPLHGNAGEGGHHHNEIAYKMVGRMAPTGGAWDNAILVPIEAVWAVHDMEHDHNHDDSEEALQTSFEHGAAGVPAIIVKPKTIADAYKLRQEYRGNGTTAVFPAEVLTNLYGMLGNAKSILMFVALGTQILIACALIFVALLHIGERRRQIGALRALGASRGKIFTLVWSEVAILLGAGIVAGFGLGFAASKMMSRIVTQSSGFAMPVSFEMQDLNSMIIMLVGASVIGLLPALMAYRQSPVSALRG
ncbi:putative ABC transport system permease protein [Paenochrobactrum gallinarii]|uniref:Putative ABC transport system permease protein n=1 Tax=Paenochrobactrum gallinarii TaxID=643673 RepID=A0A841M884_9HYPH|nr:ABC transporter permease [Paenochrobactrum gallinarii]MBB6261754.1 putative ABC transport system permease protein [Paenochrobactrum gallinarii]